MNYDYFPEIARQLGKRGGEKTFQKYGNAYMKELSNKAAEARKRKKESHSILPIDIERSVS